MLLSVSFQLQVQYKCGRKFPQDRQGQYVPFLALMPLEHCQSSGYSLPLVGLGTFLLLCPVAWVPPIFENRNSRPYANVLFNKRKPWYLTYPTRKLKSKSKVARQVTHFIGLHHMFCFSWILFQFSNGFKLNFSYDNNAFNEVRKYKLTIMWLIISN